MVTSLSSPWAETGHPGLWPLSQPYSLILTMAVLTDHFYPCFLLLATQQESNASPHGSTKVVSPACDYSYGHKNNSVFFPRFSQMESNELISVHYYHPPEELHQNRLSTRKHIICG